MALTTLLTPIALALLILAIVLLVQGVRLRSVPRLLTAAAILLLLAAGWTVLLEFITRM